MQRRARQRVCAAFSARARRANEAMDTPLPDVLFPTETHRKASPDRRTGNVEEDSMVGATDVIHACIVGAMRAPSAHNAQPWRLSRVDGRSYLLWYAFADKLRADPDDRDGLIAVGGFLETLRLEAQLRGLDASLSPATERHAHGITLGTVTFTDLAGEPDPLAHAIGRRRCDRHPYSRTPLPSDLTDGLTALGNVMLPPSEVAPLVSRAAAASWQDDRFVADMTTWTRWVPVAPDGMTFDCLRLDRFEQMALWLALRLGRLPGRLAAIYARHEVRLTMASASMAALVTESRDPQALLECGRRLIRSWTLINAMGFSWHPMSVVIDQATVTDLAAMVGGRDAVAIYRVGFTPHVGARSQRRSLADVLVPLPDAGRQPSAAQG